MRLSLSRRIPRAASGCSTTTNTKTRTKTTHRPAAARSFLTSAVLSLLVVLLPDSRSGFSSISSFAAARVACNSSSVVSGGANAECDNCWFHVSSLSFSSSTLSTTSSGKDASTTDPSASSVGRLVISDDGFTGSEFCESLGDSAENAMECLESNDDVSNSASPCVTSGSSAQCSGCDSPCESFFVQCAYSHCVAAWTRWGDCDCSAGVKTRTWEVQRTGVHCINPHGAFESTACSDDECSSSVDGAGDSRLDAEDDSSSGFEVSGQREVSPSSSPSFSPSPSTTTSGTRSESSPVPTPEPTLADDGGPMETPIGQPPSPEIYSCSLAWGTWGDCSVTCGEGVRSRVFKPTTTDGDCSGDPSNGAVDEEQCEGDGEFCAVDCEGIWAGWSCQPGSCVNERSYQIITEPAYGGENCSDAPFCLDTKILEPCFACCGGSGANHAVASAVMLGTDFFDNNNESTIQNALQDVCRVIANDTSVACNRQQVPALLNGDLTCSPMVVLGDHFLLSSSLEVELRLNLRPPDNCTEDTPHPSEVAVVEQLQQQLASAACPSSCNCTAGDDVFFEVTVTSMQSESDTCSFIRAQASVRARLQSVTPADIQAAIELLMVVPNSSSRNRNRRRLTSHGFEVHSVEIDRDLTQVAVVVAVPDSINQAALAALVQEAAALRRNFQSVGVFEVQSVEVWRGAEVSTTFSSTTTTAATAASTLTTANTPTALAQSTADFSAEPSSAMLMSPTAQIAATAAGTVVVCVAVLAVVVVILRRRHSKNAGEAFESARQAAKRTPEQRLEDTALALEELAKAQQQQLRQKSKTKMKTSSESGTSGGSDSRESEVGGDVVSIVAPASQESSRVERVASFSKEDMDRDLEAGFPADDRTTHMTGSAGSSRGHKRSHSHSHSRRRSTASLQDVSHSKKFRRRRKHGDADSKHGPQEKEQEVMKFEMEDFMLSDAGVGATGGFFVTAAEEDSTGRHNRPAHRGRGHRKQGSDHHSPNHRHKRSQSRASDLNSFIDQALVTACAAPTDEHKRSPTADQEITSTPVDILWRPPIESSSDEEDGVVKSKQTPIIYL